MTYTELFEHIWNAPSEAERQRRINALSKEERIAWEAIELLGDRKGFEWWWRADDFEDESRDEIFEELKRIARKHA